MVAKYKEADTMVPVWVAVFSTALMGVFVILGTWLESRRTAFWREKFRETHKKLQVAELFEEKAGRLEQGFNEAIEHIARQARHNPGRDPQRCSAVLGKIERYVRRKLREAGS